jgi:thiamine-monophosphate kinase
MKRMPRRKPQSRTPRTGEARLIDSFARAIDAAGIRPRGLVVGVGDDAAVFRGRVGEDLIVTQDVHVEGRHFQKDWFSGFQLGWRLAAVNLSDVAAMGARPLYGLFSLVLPSGCDRAYVKQIEKGIVAHLARFGAGLVGGNISGTDGPLICDLTLVGACGRGKAWRRHARPADAVVVVGRLGEAAAGLELLKSGRAERRRGRLVNAYKKPRPLLAVAEVLAGLSCVRGAIDVSDGLSTDLIHICEAAGVGCEIDSSKVSASRALARYCRERGKDPLAWIMSGGDDYALVLAVSPGKTAGAVARIKKELDLPVAVLGWFTRRTGCYLLDGKKRRRITATGWDHLER